MLFEVMKLDYHLSRVSPFYIYSQAYQSTLLMWFENNKAVFYAAQLEYFVT